MAATPRVPPVAPADRTEQQIELLAGVGGERALNIFATLVRHPGLFRRWLPFGGKLLQGGKLSGREREILILRTAWRCQAGYEWAQHVAIARDAGLSDDEIRSLAKPVDEQGGWSDGDALLVRIADEVLDHHRLGDDTFAAARAAYDDERLIEALMLPGHYAMLAGVLGTFDVAPEGPAPALGETEATPAGG
jgi:alkylhydroperoxidase family enzyme